MKRRLSYDRVTVSKGLRELIRAIYPGLDKNPAYWRFLQWLLYGSFKDGATGDCVVTQYVCATLEGRLSDLFQGRYVAEDFLKRFSDDVLPIVWSKHSYTNYVNHQARHIESYELDKTVAQAVYNDLRTPWTPKNRVFFVSGRAFSKKTQAVIREMTRGEAMRALAKAGCREAGEMLAYMNGLPPHRFTKAMRHIDEAIVAAARLENEIVAMQQLRILRHIASQPMPFYGPVDRSCRIFPFEECIPSLKRSIRAILCQDWINFDLCSAQLAICAAEWQVEAVQTFLRGNGNIWQELFRFFGWAEDSHIKGIFKSALYGVLYGAGEQLIITTFEDDGLTEEDARRFLAHPLIAAMWVARRARLTQIRRDNGAYDCFGTWVKMPRDKHETTGKFIPNPPSVLAQLGQAFEVKLMYPIVQLAQQTDEFAIVLWLHDGVYIDFRDPGKAKRWTHRFTEAVKQQANAMGIHTHLEVA